MARLSNVKNNEEILKHKRSILRNFSLMTLLKAIEVSAVVYIAYKLSGV